MSETKSFELVSFDNDKKKNSFDFNEYKFIFYSDLFYVLGLFIGAYFYKIAGNERLNNLLEISDKAFINMLLADFCIYFSIYLITAFLGFCLIGKPIVYSIPVITGIAIGIKLSYYYICYNAKGVGYSLIMIVPYVALFLTVIVFTIDTSTDLSSKLIKMAKGEGENKFELSPYLKKYLIYGLIIVAVSLLDSGLTKLLFTVVTI